MSGASRWTCGNCRFWVAIDASDGECHRHAPVVVQLLCDDGGGETRWPYTQPDSACGDFRSNKLTDQEAMPDGFPRGRR